MDIRTQTSLLASVLCFAIAAAVLLRPRKRNVHWLFALFGATVAAWYLTTFLARVLEGGPIIGRLNVVCAVLLPAAAVQFFRAFVEEEARRATLLNRVSVAVSLVLIAVALTPFYQHPIVASVIVAYVFVTLGAALYMVYARGRAAKSRFESARLKYLALVGALAATFTLVDYLPYFGVEIPPVGTVLTLVFLYVLSQSIQRYRLLDLYELAGKLAVLTTLSFSLAAIFWVLVQLAGGRFFLHAVVAALVLLLVFDPVRVKVEEKISQILFRERYDLEQAVSDLRRRLAHVLELEDLARIVIAGFERSRRVTHASLYLVDEDMRGYRVAGFTGPQPAQRIELAPARPLLDRLKRDEVTLLEVVERELAEQREAGEEREAETSHEIAQTLEAMHASLCIALRGEAEIYGFLCVRDERLRDAYSPEDVQLLRGLAAQAAIAVENSRLYQRMKERDRLAALGEMAAGLAHEIRNPLGAIKAAAQYLDEPAPTGGASPGTGAPGEVHGTGEFLDIIVEEVDRLNRVVSSFLDYARPSRGNPAPTDVNAAVRRTLQVLAPETTGDGLTTRLELGEDLPPVKIDVEQLRQVLINLVQNSLQAMENRGEIVVATASRERAETSGAVRRWVELRVSDTGPGIPQRVLANLFVPFVTTKDRGTGLGLAVSQRIVSAAGGHIEVRTNQGVGTTFVVRLPAADEMPLPAAVVARRPPEEGRAAEPQSPPPAGDGASASSEPAGETASGVATSR